MKQRHQILNDPRFHLVYNVSQGFSMGPEPSRVRMNREHCTVAEGLKKKSVVHPGMLLAVHSSPEHGNLFSPIHGVIEDITARSIFITAAPAPHDAPETAPRFLLEETLSREELRTALKDMGVNTRSLGQSCETLIVNALNPDPGVTWAEPILLTHVKTLRAGMALLRRLTPAKHIILAVPSGMNVVHEGLELAFVKPEYPNSVNDLLVKAVTGKEKPEGVGVVGLHNVWSLGRVAVTGLPLTETVITIGSYAHWGNYIVKEGSTVRELLDFANVQLKDGDTVVRGGPLRGESLDGTHRSVTRGTHGLFVVEAGTIPPMEGHSPCVNCSACVQVCPARLRPSALSRYAEFALHERCREEHIDSCLECGLCGYVCIARRPVLQYIRLAKKKLAEEDARKKLLEITPVSGNLPPCGSSLEG